MAILGRMTWSTPSTRVVATPRIRSITRSPCWGKERVESSVDHVDRTFHLSEVSHGGLRLDAALE